MNSEEPSSVEMERCESNGCIKVDTLVMGDGNVSVRFHSTETDTMMRATQAETDAFIRRVQAGELNYLLLPVEEIPPGEVANAIDTFFEDPSTGVARSRPEREVATS